MKQFIVLVAILAIICLSSNLYAQDDLQLTLKIDNEAYNIGDEINITLIWENVSDEEIIFITQGERYLTNCIRIKDSQGTDSEAVSLVRYGPELFPQKEDCISLMPAKDALLNKYILKLKGIVKQGELKGAARTEPYNGMYIDFKTFAILLNGKDLYTILAEYRNMRDYYYEYSNGQLNKIPISAWRGKIESSSIKLNFK